MSGISGMECNGCKKQVITDTFGAAKNWVSIGTTDNGFSGLLGKPSTHLCPDCWAKAKAAVIPSE